jgi:hypothetical protein
MLMKQNMYGHSSNNNGSTLTGPLSYESFLQKLGPKDRVNAEKHVATCETEPDSRHAVLWRRLVCRLMELAGHSAKLNRQPQSAQFYLADGKYRMQVFALEDGPDGDLSIYCGDVLEQMVKTGKLIVQESGEQANSYRVAHSPDVLTIERLDGKSVNPAAYFKDMLGWNRKAIRMVLSKAATASQVAAVEALCTLSIGGTKSAAVA